MHELSQEVVLPWCLFDGECGEHIYIMDAEDSQVVRFHKSQSEIATRVVASVNACRGIGTAELMESDFGEDSVEVGVLLGLVMQQRDDLLASLKRATAHIDEITVLGGKYSGLTGDLVADSYDEASAARKAIEAVSGLVMTDSDGGHCD